MMIPGVMFRGLTLLMTVLFPMTEVYIMEVQPKLDAQPLDAEVHLRYVPRV
jgi:hypothetical protein